MKIKYNQFIILFGCVTIVTSEVLPVMWKQFNSAIQL